MEFVAFDFDNVWIQIPQACSIRIVTKLFFSMNTGGSYVTTLQRFSDIIYQDSARLGG